MTRSSPWSNPRDEPEVRAADSGYQTLEERAAQYCSSEKTLLNAEVIAQLMRLGESLGKHMREQGFAEKEADGEHVLNTIRELTENFFVILYGFASDDENNEASRKANQIGIENLSLYICEAFLDAYYSHCKHFGFIKQARTPDVILKYAMTRHIKNMLFRLMKGPQS